MKSFKVLMVTCTASMTGQFNMNNLRLLKDMGASVHVACNFREGNTFTDAECDDLRRTLSGMDIRYHQVDFTRRGLSMQHKKSYDQLLRICSNERFDFIHCHTPTAAAVARLVARKTGTKILYTAHGFHFFTGAPLKNWLFFFPIERYLSKYTDAIVTINREDFGRAKHLLKAGNVFYIPGIGIDISSYRISADEKMNIRQRIRNTLGLSKSDTALLNVGELINRKDQETIIRALSLIKDPRIVLLLCGQGPEEEHLRQKARELGVEDRVRMLGFRDDIMDLHKAADIFVFSSRQEGLPVALMEAIADRMPVITTEIRGNTDLVRSRDFTYRPGDYKTLAELIKLASKDYPGTIIRENSARLKHFDINNVEQKMRQIYEYMAEL